MLVRLAIAIVFLMSGGSALMARPALSHVSPAAGSTLRQAPSAVSLSFTEALLPPRSDAVVRNATGAVVSSGKARVIGKKAQMQVPVNSLSPGKYRVEWYATSADNRPSQGSFTFIVGENHTTRAAERAQGASHRAPLINRQPGVRRHRGD
jgi:methionine-rich copper-binding protein CopC